jgi:hypothetical protein
VIFFTTVGVSTFVFRSLLQRDPAHGGWLIVALLVLTSVILVLALSKEELLAAGSANAAGLRASGPPFLVLSLVSGAGSAWTFWAAQSQVGAIKGGLTLLPTLNLTSEAMLAYIGKAFVPAFMSVSYTWSSFPYVSLKGLLGAAIVCASPWLAVRLAGASERNHRLTAFGIFWFFIALVPVSNLVPTSTKMADRYLFVPTVGVVLIVLGVASILIDRGLVKSSLVGVVLVAVVGIYSVWSYKRTEVWCGKTTMWKGTPHPDLSIWTSAVDTNPTDAMALMNLSLVLLRLDPPQTEEARADLNRALELSETNQSNIAGGKQIILTPMYEGLGDAYLIEAKRLEAASTWLRRMAKEKGGIFQFAEVLRKCDGIPVGFCVLRCRGVQQTGRGVRGRSSNGCSRAGVRSSRLTQPADWQARSIAQQIGRRNPTSSEDSGGWQFPAGVPRRATA